MRHSVRPGLLDRVQRPNNARCVPPRPSIPACCPSFDSILDSNDFNGKSVAEKCRNDASSLVLGLPSIARSLWRNLLKCTDLLLRQLAAKEWWLQLLVFCSWVAAARIKAEERSHKSQQTDQTALEHIWLGVPRISCPARPTL